MYDLNGWYLDKSKFCCENVVVYNMDFCWFIMADGTTLPNLDFYCAEDALKEASQYIKRA